MDDGVQLEVGVFPNAPGLVPGGAAGRHGPRRREGQQAARVRPRPRRLDESQDASGGQQKKDRLKKEHFGIKLSIFHFGFSEPLMRVENSR